MATRTITRTDAPPVQIEENVWPLIASAVGDSYAERDSSRYRQARSQGELDTYFIGVRQHLDGRAIVYGVVDGSQWTTTETHRGGELLDADDDICSAIRRVGWAIGIPEGLIRECIADLPVVVLD